MMDLIPASRFSWQSRQSKRSLSDTVIARSLPPPGTPHVVCRFAGAHSLDEAFNTGSLIAQEALDILSMTGRADLVTREADDEFLAWWCSKGLRSIAMVSTATFSVKVGPITLTVRDAQGNVVPPTPVVPKHHIGFRFYRLAQTSDDLYDAYRNMYLAFESLLSSQYPKNRGLEIDWLRHSLNAASSDLQLSSLVPVGISDPPAHILTEIYDGARLPLFHAKDGKAYFAPVHSAADRQEITAALATLTQIVIRMADKWYAARRLGGWVNLKLLEEQNGKLFGGSQFVFTDNPAFTLQDDLGSESIKNGVHFPATFSEFYGGDQRHNIGGQIHISALASRGRLHALYLINENTPLMGVSPDTTIDLSGFDVFEIRLFVRGRNGSAPKYMYLR